MTGVPEACPGPAPDGEWLRVHPASPFVRGWVALAAIGFFFGRDIFERMLQGRPLIEEDFAGRAPWLVAGGGIVLVITVLGFILTWYFTKYQVSEGYVRVNSGFLFRQQRQARLDRVQAIDIVQPLLARIFGLAELKFEVADAGESAVRLAYLRMDDARQLRATILARAAGVVPDPARPQEAAPEAPEYPVLSVPPSRLIGSLLLSEQSFFVVLGGVASVILSAVTENRGFYLYLIPGGARPGRELLGLLQQGLQLHRGHLPGRDPATLRAPGHAGTDPPAGQDPGAAGWPSRRCGGSLAGTGCRSTWPGTGPRAATARRRHAPPCCPSASWPT